MLLAHLVLTALAHGHHAHHFVVCTHPFLTVSRTGVVQSTPVTCTRVR